MISSPNIIKLLNDNFFLKQSKEQMQVGNKLIQFLLMKIACYDLKDKKLYDLLNQHICKIIIDAVQISDVNHLRMCFGKVAEEGDYGQLKKIESQIMKIIVKKDQTSTIVMSIGSTSILNKTFESQYNTSLNNSKIKYQFPQSIFPINNSRILKSSQFSSIKKQESYLQESQQEQEQELEDQDQDQDLLQMFGPQKGLEGLHLFRMQGEGSKNTLNGASRVSSDQVSKYLQQIISPMSELNLVVQKLKLLLGTWVEQNEGKIQKNHLIILSVYNNGQQDVIKASGNGSNKKKARDDAATNILLNLYVKYPAIFKQIKQIKLRSAIKC